jgi:hypothetical protein
MRAHGSMSGSQARWDWREESSSRKPPATNHGFHKIRLQDRHAPAMAATRSLAREPNARYCPYQGQQSRAHNPKRTKDSGLRVARSIPAGLCPTRGSPYGDDQGSSGRAPLVWGRRWRLRH